MTCLGRTGWRRHVQPPPGKMVQDGGETMDGPPSEAVAEAVDGLEAEVTTVVEVTEAVPATSMVAGEEGAITIEPALVPLYPVLECFYFLVINTRE
jgi:hypothetical protein